MPKLRNVTVTIEPAFDYPTVMVQAEAVVDVRTAGGNAPQVLRSRVEKVDRYSLRDSVQYVYEQLWGICYACNVEFNSQAEIRWNIKGGLSGTITAGIDVYAMWKEAL